jgi:Flp pilus assembly protein TadD
MSARGETAAVAEVDAPSAGPGSAHTPEKFARLLHKGSELLRDGDPSRAREHLEDALRLDPANPAARNLLALSFFQIGHLERALHVYEGLLAEIPDSVAAKVNLAVVLLKLGRAESARPLLEGVVRASPDHRRAWGYLGVAFEQLGRIADAEAAFLAGHHGSAAKRLGERHARVAAEVSPAPAEPTDLTSTLSPPFRRRTLPPDPWMSSAASAAQLAYNLGPRFTATIAPPNLAADDDEGARVTEPPPESRVAADELGDDAAMEIPFERTVSPAVVPPPMNQPAKASPVLPLLDAALSSLLVVPHEATVVTHPSGLVMAGLVEGGQASPEGGFAVRADAVTALAGSLRRCALPRRPPPAPAPFVSSPGCFALVSGTGQLVLAPPKGTRLLPLEMNADVAFLREDLVVAFDHALLYDLGRMPLRSGAPLSLVRFRGDGVIVLGLERPFLAFDVHGSEVVSLRADALIGWIGLLTPEPAAPARDLEDPNELLAFAGEGTVLFSAPIEP